LNETKKKKNSTLYYLLDRAPYNFLYIFHPNICIRIGHPFWKLAELQRKQDFQIVLENIALTGGLLLAATASQYKSNKDSIK
jgi:hypothetical protein